MSETKKPTAAEAIENLKEEFKSIMRHHEGDLDKYTRKMNEDFEYFFRWHGDDMYKTSCLVKWLRAFRPAIYLASAEKIEMAIQNHINNTELELIEGSGIGTSTNPMQNMAHTLAFEAKREFRADLQRMLYAIQYRG